MITVIAHDQIKRVNDVTFSSSSSKQINSAFMKQNWSPSMSAHDHAFIHINPSTIFGASLLRCGLITLPPVLNTDSDATVVTGIAMISLAPFSKLDT
jgi:hypothetical protein